MDLAAMERQVAEQADRRAIPHLSAEERAAMVVRYQAMCTQIDGEIEQALAGIGPDPKPEHYQILRDLSRLGRSRRSAQAALVRIQRAIAQAEKPQKRRADAPLLLLADHTTIKKEQGDEPL